MTVQDRRIYAIDLFCGAGGLSHGLQQAGVPVIAGFDIDETCRFPFERNIDAPFLAGDVRGVSGEALARLWPAGELRLLAGCAPCQPFSPYRRGRDTTTEEQWPLLDEFGRLVAETVPHVVTMENVPRIRTSAVFGRFVAGLEALRYHVDVRSCYGPNYGLPQRRRRLVLLASRLGPIEVPVGEPDRADRWTVRRAIGRLPALEAGEQHPRDALHQSRALSELNLERIRASVPGGTWRDWPEELLAPCHRKATGSSFQSVYARMEWDQPAPTITTMAHNYGTGRFGHPVQDRPISLREAAILQGFPRSYRFLPPKEKVEFSHLGRLIGNAVPPPLGAAIGSTVVEHLQQFASVGAPE